MRDANQHWIEDLHYSVEIFSVRGDLEEVLAKVSLVDMARAVYDVARKVYPGRLVFIRERARVLARSDRPD